MLLRIKNKLNREFLNLKFQSGLYKLSKNDNHKIITYHGIAPTLAKPLNIRHISPEIFEKHLQFLQKNTHVISVSDFFNQKFVKGKKNIAITFDDGYLNNLKYAVPLLEKYKMPASIYITGINTTSHKILWPDYHDLVVSSTTKPIIYNDITFHKVGGNYQRPYISANGINFHEFLKTLSFAEKMQILDKYSGENSVLSERKYFDYWKLLSDEEIIKLAQSKFITIGSHGMYHNNLGFINPSDAKNELIESKKYLENLIHKEVTSVAYPDGSYSPEIINIAKESGYNVQLAVNYLFNEENNEQGIINREGLYSYETLAMQYQNIYK